MDLAEEVYQQTQNFPREELYGLTSQIRRAVVSVPANIAEGYGRIHRKEYIHHLSIAQGSLQEAETQLQITVRLQYLDREQVKRAWNLMQDVGKMLRRLMLSLSEKKTQPKDPRPETQDPGSEG
ncbi:four helix bundle protein [Candidatus Chloroploca mongolica]